jgi:integrase
MRRFIGNRKFGFYDLSVSFLKDYSEHLTELGNKRNTVTKELKLIRAVLNTAVEEGLFPKEHDPFLKFKIPSEKGNKEKLSADDVERMEKLKLEPNSLIWHVRNYWLFSMYCAGIRFGDMCKLRWSDISHGRLTYVMTKTEEPKSILLIPQAQKILDYYKEGRTPNGLIFPLLEEKDFASHAVFYARKGSRNAVVNKVLKEIAELADIRINVTFHISRHTFADIARKKIGTAYGIYEVSKMLGHSSIKVTESYLKSFDQESVDDAMNSIFD